MKLDLVVFDLDDTLLDTTRALIPIRNSPHFADRLKQPLPLLEGALESLEHFKLRSDLFLLTQGRRDYQSQKIHTLGIRHFFKEVIICEPDKGESKAEAFKKIIVHSSGQNTCLTIGNRVETDIFPGQDAGFKAVWFRYGEGSDYQLGDRKPNWTVTDHRMLRTLFP